MKIIKWIVIALAALGSPLAFAAELHLYAGAGLRVPVDQIVARYEKESGNTVIVEYGGSGQILTRYQLTQQGDLFLPGSADYVEKLRQQGKVAAAFPLVWTTLFGAIWIASTATICDLEDAGQDAPAAEFRGALAVNLALNAAWSGLFFRAHHLPVATAGAAVLAASSADLARRAAKAGPGKAVSLGLYAAWCGFATVLSGTIARLNR